jgi:hypothetical protein
MSLPMRCGERHEDHMIARRDLSRGAQQFDRAAHVPALQRVETEAEQRLWMARLESTDFVPQPLGVLESTGGRGLVGRLNEIWD